MAIYLQLYTTHFITKSRSIYYPPPKLHFLACLSRRAFCYFPLSLHKVIPRRHLSTSNDSSLRSKTAVTFIPVVLNKVDYPFRSSGRLKEFARKFRRLLSRIDFLSEKNDYQYAFNVVIKKRRQCVFTENLWIENLGISRIKDPKTSNSKRIFSPNYFDEIDVLPTHDRQDVINARNKRCQRKIWNPRNVSLILPGTYIFREFPFPRSRSDRYISNSVVWNYLRSHVPGIIYYRRQLTSVVNRHNLNLKIKTQNDICEFSIE